MRAPTVRPVVLMLRFEFKARSQFGWTKLQHELKSSRRDGPAQTGVALCSDEFYSHSRKEPQRKTYKARHEKARGEVRSTQPRVMIKKT